MPFARSKITTVAIRLVTLASCICVLAGCVFAQTAQLIVTPDPSSVSDAATPSDVVLHLIKADGTGVPQNFASQLGSVKVGTTAAVIKATDERTATVTITPPANLTGTQTVQLLDRTGQLLGQTRLQYPAQSATSNATPPPIEVRQNSLSQSWWYRVAVIVFFLLVVGIFVFTLARVINFSRSSFRNPLGFPVGSFRAMLAFTLVAFLGFYIFASVLSISNFPPPESLLGIVATVIGFYFGSRTSEEGATDPGVAGIVRGMVNAGKEPAAGAIVRFRREDGSEPYMRVTDMVGRFTPVNAKPGKYTVHAELTGLKAAEVTITVAEGSDQEIVITLTAP